MHIFTNYKFDILIYEDKFRWNWFEWSSSYVIYFSQNKIWKAWTKEIISRNFKRFGSDKLKLDISNSMSAVSTHAAFENNFVSILDKYAPGENKNFYEGIKRLILIRTFASKWPDHVSKTSQISRKILV